MAETQEGYPSKRTQRVTCQEQNFQKLELRSAVTMAKRHLASQKMKTVQSLETREDLEVVLEGQFRIYNGQETQ